MITGFSKNQSIPSFARICLACRENTEYVLGKRRCARKARALFVAVSYESFICWEGDGMTYAVYDPDNIEIVSRSLVQMPGMT
jgi:hypothetical protein